MVLYISIGATFLITVFILILFNSSTKCNVHNIKVEETIDNIKILLEKKLDILLKIYKEINKDREEKLLERIPKIKKKELDIFDLDKELSKIYKEFKEDLEERKDIILDDTEKEHISDIDNNDIELKGIKIYYNEITNEYNQCINSFPNNIIKLIKHYKERETYTIEKEVAFEILKKK